MGAVASADFQTLQLWITAEDAGRVRQIQNMWYAAGRAFFAERRRLQSAKAPLTGGGWQSPAANEFYAQQEKSETSLDNAGSRTWVIANELETIAGVIDRVKAEMQALQQEWNSRMASIANPAVQHDQTTGVSTVSLDGQTQTVRLSPPPTPVPGARAGRPSTVPYASLADIQAQARQQAEQDLTERARRIMSQLEQTYTAATTPLLSNYFEFTGPRDAVLPPPGARRTTVVGNRAGAGGGARLDVALNSGGGGAGGTGGSALPDGAINPGGAGAGGTGGGALPDGAINPGAAGAGDGGAQLWEASAFISFAGDTGGAGATGTGGIDPSGAGADGAGATGAPGGEAGSGGAGALPADAINPGAAAGLGPAGAFGSGDTSQGQRLGEDAIRPDASLGGTSDGAPATGPGSGFDATTDGAATLEAGAGPIGAGGLPPGAIQPNAGDTTSGGLPSGAIEPNAADAAVVGFPPGGRRAGAGDAPVGGLPAGAIETGAAAATTAGLAANAINPGAVPPSASGGTNLAGRNGLNGGAVLPDAGLSALTARVAPMAVAAATPPVGFTPLGASGTLGVSGSAAAPATGVTPNMGMPPLPLTPAGVPPQLGGRRGETQGRSKRRARQGAFADHAGDTDHQPQIAGRTGDTPVAAVHLPDMPGAVGDGFELTTDAPPPQLRRVPGAGRPEQTLGASVVPDAARVNGFPGEPSVPAAANRDTGDAGRRVDLGGAQRRTADDVEVAAAQSDSALTGRSDANGMLIVPDVTLRRRRGSRSVAPPDHPDEDVWSNGNGRAAIVDAPATSDAEEAPGPALGQQQVAQPA
jgi:hypothetical protein